MRKKWFLSNLPLPYSEGKKRDDTNHDGSNGPSRSPREFRSAERNAHKEEYDPNSHQNNTNPIEVSDSFPLRFADDASSCWGMVPHPNRRDAQDIKNGTNDKIDSETKSVIFDH